MDNSKKTKLAWKACEGRKFDRTNHKPGTKDELINIPEEPRSFDMDPPATGSASQSSGANKPPYGRMIDGDTAVYLIREFIRRLPHRYTELVAQAKSNSEAAADDQKAAVIDMNTMMLLLNEVVMTTYGTGFDKRVVMKILSQPRCEGLRSYLCVKLPEDAAQGANIDSQEGLPWSLVLVGVDAEGNDLHYKELIEAMENGEYDAKEKQQNNSAAAEGEDVPTNSAIAEYGHPPTNTKLDGLFLNKLTKIDKRFSLLYLAHRTL